MRPKYLLLSVTSVTIIAITVLLVAAGFLPPGTDDQTNSPIDIRDPLVEQVDLDVDPGTGISPVSEPAAIQPAPSRDGQSLLESYCTKCHPAQLLEKTEKSRTEWEEILEQMEALGVRLDDAEKVILLDYLAISNKP